MQLDAGESQDGAPQYQNRDADHDGDVDFKDALILAEYDSGEREDNPRRPGSDHSLVLGGWSSVLV